MIIGIGHDLVQIERVTSIVAAKHGIRFIERILTVGEQTIAKQYENARLHQFIAGRFAAKEAVSKAFGTGLGSQLSFTDIEVLPGQFGKPFCKVSPQAKLWSSPGMNELQERCIIHLSITHEQQLASAFAIVEKM